MERPTDNLIYNRTFSDVQRVAELNRKISKGEATVEEMQEWFQSKGALNHTDLNRIETWTEYLSNYLKSYGYSAPIKKRAERTYIPQGGKPLLPDGYTELSYIESTGGQYIKTGFIPDNNTRVVFKGYNTSASSGWTFGTWDGSAKNQYAFSCNASYSFRYGTKNVQLFSVPVGDFEVDFNKNQYKLNDTQGNFAEEEFLCTHDMYLFAINANGTVSGGKYTGRLYKCEIYDDGVIVLNFVPCINSDGEIGLYDLIGGSFYGNAGTGAFIAGEILQTLVPQPIYYSDWREWDIPHLSEINRIRDNVNSLKNGFYKLSDWRDIINKINPNFEDINAVEWDLQTIYQWLQLFVLNFTFSGELYAGETW